MGDQTAEPPEALIPQFVFERLLNQDNQGRRIILLGKIKSQPALLLIERAAFGTSTAHLSAFVSSLQDISNLGDNDIYRWYLARSSSSPTTTSDDEQLPHDLKLNLIYPCTPKHIAKYTPQPVRYVTETPSIYAHHVRPWIASQRDRLTWVFNILDGLTEQEDVLFRSWTPPPANEEDKRFLLLPDLNWDRRTLAALHLLALPARRDIWSLRDLRKEHVPWLREMQSRIASSVAQLYGKGGERIEGDMVPLGPGALKFYLHYQPTYHHLHIHVVNVALDPGATQAVGKAMDLGLVISILDNLPEGGSMADLELAYTVGEGSDLWKTVWEPLLGEGGR